MFEAFRLGGWGMYPTLVAGGLLFITSLLYLRDPSGARMRVVRSLSRLVMLTSTLGFVAGLIATFTGVSSDLGNEFFAVVFQGVGESLHNIGQGVAWLVVSAIITTLGVSRDKDAPTLTDPHQR